MACHEIAALRLGLMRVLGRTDEAERRHELAELGGAAAEAGPIKTLCETRDLAGMKRAYDAAAALEERVAATAPGDPKLPYLRNGVTGPTLVFATDTGITAALGLVQGARFQALAAEAIVIWLRTTPDYFLPETLVRERVPPACRALRIAASPPIGDPERVAEARAILREVLERVVIRQAFVCGDGAVNYALLDDLVAAGVPATKDHLESFFNMPKKSG